MHKDTKLQFVTTFAALITAAFGLVAAMAWNEAIQEAIPKADNQLLWMFIYAILVTILAVVVIIIIARQTKRLTEQINAEDEKK
jgi:fructose-specific phosphotransferase system IIC component